MYNNIFEFASGSVIGRDHLYVGSGRRRVLVGKNNQDVRIIFLTDHYLMAFVLDGCGSGLHSDVGANVAATLLVQAFEKYLRFHASSHVMFNRIHQDVLAEIRVLANGMSPSLSRVISNYFLFTVVGLYMDRSQAAVFSIGDGVFFVNGEMTEIGPFPDNAPPYMAYGITGSPLTREHPELLEFQIHVLRDIADIESILIGTDGVSQLVAAADKTIPGREELVGPISQFWEDDRYYTNAFAASRRLNLINNDYIKITEQGIVEECGRLKDDTTFVVVRRKKT